MAALADEAKQEIPMMKTFISASAATLILGMGLSASCSQGGQAATDNYTQTAQNEAGQSEPTESVSESMIGAAVYDSNDQQIGTIEDVMVAEDGTEQAIVSVGEYLAIGAQQIAIPTSELALKADASGYSLSMTAEDLEASALEPGLQEENPSEEGQEGRQY
jgi:hypothetical protein